MAAAAALAAAAIAPAAADAGQIKAGAAQVDASWHVGASAGQYASDGTFASVEESDPSQHSTRRAPSYGIESRLNMRAIVVQGPGGNLFAVVKADFYIPQDLVWRRTAQLLEQDGTGINRTNLTMAVTHDHSSPMYQSTSWGVWTFQDVFDFRFFEYAADKMRDAVEQAKKNLEPVRVGASVTQYDFPQRNVPGPSRADDGTPAGFPNSYTDHDMIVTRFEGLKTGKPIANLVNWAVHPEDLEGNDLISGDYVAHVQRMADRVTGALTIWTQGAVGNTEPEDNRWHSIHDRAYFSHAQYAQSEFEAKGIAEHIADTSDDVKKNTPEDPQRFVPMRSSFDNKEIAFVNRWFPGPVSHPYPGVSSCHTESAVQGDPRAPIVGLPDCEGSPAAGAVNPEQDPGISTDTIKQFGIPVPDNYSAPAYTGLEEDVSVHLQAFRIGDILYTVCSCEQWADQSKDIKTRTDRVPGNQWIGYDWFPQCVKENDGTYDGPLGYGTGHWTCPNPDGGTFTHLPDKNVERFHHQVVNPANGWDDISYAPKAESEDPNLKLLKGNYTHDDYAPDTAKATQDANAALGYKLTVAMAMANDYNGYIVTYREYQRGDHYRKALTAWGPHSSDYLATRLVKMGRYLHDTSKSDPFPPMPTTDEVVDEWPGGGAKVKADLQNNENRDTVIGNFAENGIKAYEAQLPDDQDPKIVNQPADVQRFGAAFFRWDGGSNYTDMPSVKVQRRSGGKWHDYADQSGELPVTLKFPSAGELPAYRQGGYAFPWTAHFEVYVSSFDPPDRPQATPPGSYRFTVDGHYRKGGSVKTYHLDSKTFQVGVWTGIKANELANDSGVVSFKVGPRHTYNVPLTAAKGETRTVAAEIGPIDYPDSYANPLKAKYIDPARYFFRDRTAPSDPSKFEWYCRGNPDDDAAKVHGCSFRPWMDFGDASRAVITFVDKSGKAHRVQAQRTPHRWVSPRKLGPGESAYVESGDVCDRFGDYNDAPSAPVGSKVVAKDPPAGYSCLPKSATSGGPKAAGFKSGKNPLGLPPTKNCLDRRKFRFRIHQPRKGRVVAVNVFVNGKRTTHRHKHRIKSITLRKLPKKRFVVKIVAITNRGFVVVSKRRYKGCKKSRPHTKVHRHKKKKGGKKHRIVVVGLRR